jgi:hypothetical protein
LQQQQLSTVRFGLSFIQNLLAFKRTLGSLLTSLSFVASGCFLLNGS